MASIRQINRVVLTGNLTRDPELGSTAGATSVCALRVACNGRHRDAQGEWEDKPNYFDVVVYGAQGERCAEYLAKGRGVAVDGRLDWREWRGDGKRREAVRIVAESVQFLGSPRAGRGADGDAANAPVDGDASERELEPVAAGEADDDIPF